MINLLDLFSGIGGFHLATKLAGIPINRCFYSEVDPYASKVYRRRYPTSMAIGDIRKADFAQLAQDFPGQWVICGGFPCQDASTAQTGQGIKGRRTGLWWHMLRAVHDIRPKFVVGENVPNIVNRGLRTALASLAAIGYDAEWNTFPASSYNAPHSRARVWIIAYANGINQLDINTTAATGRDVGEYGKLSRAANWDIAWVHRKEGISKGRLCGKPGVYRMDDGLPNWVDRLKCVGNSIVPLVAADILAKLKPHLVADCNKV